MLAFSAVVVGLTFAAGFSALPAIAGKTEGVNAGSGGSSLNIPMKNVSQILDNLLQSYDARLRPNFGEKALELDMDIVVASFDSVSEVNMDFTITLYLHQYWRDERLAWSTESRNETLTLSGDFAEKIWVPDTFLANDKHSFLHDVTETNKMIRLYSDGQIAYGIRFTSTLACKMDLRSFPMDHQNFTVEIESYGYTTGDLIMRWKNGQSAVRGVMEAEIPQFRILHYQALDRKETTATGTYQRLSLVLYLRRSIGYYIFQTYLPSILIVALSWISFWINHEATSARVALGITTVLTMTTITTGVRASLPRISYVKAIDIYLVVCFVFVFAALLEYAAVNYTYWGSKSAAAARSASIKNSNAGCRSNRGNSRDGGLHRKWNTAREFPTWKSFFGEERDAAAAAAVAAACRRKSPKTAAAAAATARFYTGGSGGGGGEEDEDDNEQSQHDDHDHQQHQQQQQQHQRRQQRSQLYVGHKNNDDSADSAASDGPSSAERVSGRVSPIPGLLEHLNRQRRPRDSVESANADEPDDPNWPTSSSSLQQRRRTPPDSASSMVDEQLRGLDEPTGRRPPGHGRCSDTGLTSGLVRRRVSFSWRSVGSPSTSGQFPAKRPSFAAASRRQLVTSLRRKAQAVKAALPRIRDVNVIDKNSRVLFPLVFVLFNVVYWCYYMYIEGRHV